LVARRRPRLFSFLVASTKKGETKSKTAQHVKHAAVLYIRA